MPRPPGHQRPVKKSGFADSEKKFPHSANGEPPGNIRGACKYGFSPLFEPAIVAVESDIQRLTGELAKARRKRRSLLAAQRQRRRWENSDQFRDDEKHRQRAAYRDRFTQESF